MRERGTKEVGRLVSQLWPPSIYAEGERPSFEFRKVDGGYVLEVSKMYEFLPLSFRRLSAISAFFGTKNVNESSYSAAGCETCDYGSKYTLKFDIREEGEGYEL